MTPGVLKRDRSVEPFDAEKLAVAIWRAMQGTNASFEHAQRVAEAVEIYLRRRGTSCVSSSAIFEMIVKALGAVGFSCAADAAVCYRRHRQRLADKLRVLHDVGNLPCLRERPQLRKATPPAL